MSGLEEDQQTSKPSPVFLIQSGKRGTKTYQSRMGKRALEHLSRTASDGGRFIARLGKTDLFYFHWFIKDLQRGVIESLLLGLTRAPKRNSKAYLTGPVKRNSKAYLTRAYKGKAVRRSMTEPKGYLIRIG